MDLSIETSALRFWIRNDAAEGVNALSRALQSRQSTHRFCYHDVLSDVLLDQWTDAALPVVTSALDDSDPEVVSSAIKVLERHAGAKWLTPSIAAVERVATALTKDNLSAFYATRNTARLLLQSPRWKLDTHQRRRLQELSSLRPR